MSHPLRPDRGFRPVPGRRVLLALALCAPLGIAPGAAFGDVVTTHEGLQIEGRAVLTKRGTWLIHTDDGRVSLAAEAVARVEKGVAPRKAWLARAAKVSGQDAVGQFKLALSAEAQGFEDLARGAYERVIATQPDHRAARRALGYERAEDGRWLHHNQVRRERGLVLYEGAWHLPAEVEALTRKAARPATGGAAPLEARRSDGRVRRLLAYAAGKDTALARAARLRLASLEHKELLQGALEALYEKTPATRVVAAQTLSELGDEAGLRALLFSSVRDTDAGVRTAAIQAAASLGHPDSAIPLIRALGSENQQIVAHAAEAIATLGDVRAARYVIRRMTAAGSSPRSYVSFLNQISYVRDYDVEIAQRSNIANPNVGFVQEGVVLDAHVLGAVITETWIEPVLADTFGRLVGQSFGSAAQAKAWYAQHGADLPDFPQAAEARRMARKRGKRIGAPSAE